MNPMVGVAFTVNSHLSNGMLIYDIAFRTFRNYALPGRKYPLGFQQALSAARVIVVNMFLLAYFQILGFVLVGPLAADSTAGPVIVTKTIYGNDFWSIHNEFPYPEILNFNVWIGPSVKISSLANRPVAACVNNPASMATIDHPPSGLWPK